MRGFVPAYEMRSPKGLAEALALLHQEPGVWKPFAGGTDLMVLLETGTLAHTRFINLLSCDELCGITEASDQIVIGATTTFRMIQDSEVLKREFPLLVRTAAALGAIAIQNRATLGGNIANASPAADSPPALLAYDARLELVSHDGSRWIPYAEFHSGYKRTMMRPDELIRAIALPKAQRSWKPYYRKVGTRMSQSISKVSFAGLADVKEKLIDDVRIVIGSVAPTVLRCRATEDALRGKQINRATLVKAREALMKEISPIDDIRSTAEYRLRVSINLLEEFLRCISPTKKLL